MLLLGKAGRQSAKIFKRFRILILWIILIWNVLSGTYVVVDPLDMYTDCTSQNTVEVEFIDHWPLSAHRHSCAEIVLGMDMATMPDEDSPMYELYNDNQAFLRNEYNPSAIDCTPTKFLNLTTYHTSTPRTSLFFYLNMTSCVRRKAVALNSSTAYVYH